MIPWLPSSLSLPSPSAAYDIGRNNMSEFNAPDVNTGQHLHYDKLLFACINILTQQKLSKDLHQNLLKYFVTILFRLPHVPTWKIVYNLKHLLFRRTTKWSRTLILNLLSRTWSIQSTSRNTIPPIVISRDRTIPSCARPKRNRQLPKSRQINRLVIQLSCP